MRKFGPWEIECDLADGARIGRLRYAGVDLLTAAPATFRPPTKDYGRHETRPVYGYDDCFPTVETCDDWPDHGELCWLKWTGSETECSVRSQRMPVTFTRRLEFSERALMWSFRATNDGDRALPVQHVMHPLMPLDDIAKIELPALTKNLVALPRGSAEMLYVTDLREGRFAVRYRQGLRLTVTFSRELFPTIAIWWNNSGYPDEEGCRRNECAFDPAPGKITRLADGTTMRLPARGWLDWQVKWEVAR